MSNIQIHDVALIGAGPVGIELAIALKNAKLDYVHFDAAQVGQTIYNFPFQTRFFSSNERIAIAGVPLQTIDQNKCTREQYLAYLRTVVQLHKLPIHTYHRITSITRKGESFLLTTSGFHGDSVWQVNKIVLCTGGTSRPRKLDIPGEDQPNVHHRFSDPHIYFRNHVMIVGGKNSAVEAALRCYQAGAHVAISYRRAAFEAKEIKYWLYPEITGLIRDGKITAFFNTTPTSFQNGVVTLQDRCTGQETQCKTDFLLPQVGYVADMTLARMAGVGLSSPTESPRIDEKTMQTNVPGVFMAGTAIGGTQDQFRLFIENCHTHAERIVAALTGKKPPANKEAPHLRPES